jgi:hypothetical protein
MCHADGMVTVTKDRCEGVVNGHGQIRA